MSNYGSSWNSTLLGEVKRPKSVHYILSITRANAVANVKVLSGEYFILQWYNTLSQEKIINVMICEKLVACLKNKNNPLWVDLLGSIM